MSDDINRQIFREEAYDLLGELEGALLELEQTPDDMDVVNQIFRALHTIKGSGSMFGFEEIAEFTHEVETVFDMVRNEDLPVSQTLCSLALKSRDYIKMMLDSSDEDGPVDPDLMQEILQGLEGLTSGDDASEDVPEADEPSVAPDGEAEPEKAEDEGVEEAPDAVDEPTSTPLDSPVPPGMHDYRITLTAKADEEVDEANLESLFEELVKLGEFTVVSRPEGESDDRVWQSTLVTDIPEDNVRDVFFFVDADLDISIFDAAPAASAPDQTPPEPVADEPDTPEAQPEEEVVEEASVLTQEPPAAPLTAETTEVETLRIGELLVKNGEVSEEDVKEALKSQKPIGQILAEQGKVAPEKVEQAVRKQSAAKEKDATRKRQDAVSSIRVSADKLDYLVDLVGELVIVQAQISQMVSERSDPPMTLLAEELERLSDELRDSTLGIRMLPIGTSFSKFRRLVRDLSGDLGKNIALSTSGEDTELDKTVIERLGDPLVHLLRNSLDHGIESPEERTAQGKPEQGVILLAAEHSGGEVLIRITDDGRGMSTESIREKAIDRGLITKDAEMTDKELLKLIFEPGFSTAEEVTNVSGRGVGMDVVKRAIDSLRGTIDIDSKPGVGTTITIRLPLTLAIIDGLQVQVGNEFYVIPLSLVEECVELARSEVDENESGQRILHLRGEIVPYIHIRDWFEIDAEQPLIEQIVITGVEGSRVGIVVDTVIGEHQTVIKSLSRVYKDVEGISGATIKGDGSIALILDVPSLIRRVIAESN